MKKQNISKIKRILASCASGALVAGAAVPVIACSDDEIKQLSEDIQKYINNLDKDDITANTTGIDDLPAPAENTHWEYKVGDGEFTTEKPTVLNPNEEVVIRLVSDDPDAPLPEKVEIEKKVQNVIVVDARIEAELNQIMISPDGTIRNEPNIENANLLFSTDNGSTYQPTLQGELTLGQEVSVKIVPVENYELVTKDESIGTEARIKVTQEVVVSADFKNAFKTVYAVTGNNQEIRNVPPAPEHTQWQYDLGGEEQKGYQFGPVDFTSLTPGKTIKMRLVADENCYLSEPVERTGIVVRDLNIPVDELNKSFENVTITTTDGLKNLPAAPANTAWTYALNEDSNYKHTFPENLQAGDKVTFMLKARFGVLSDDLAAKHTITVIGVVDTTGFAEKLATSTVVTSSDASAFPVAPEHTHWQYKVNDGDFQDEFPNSLTSNQKLTVQLVADTNYALNQDVQHDFKIPENVVINAELQAKLDAVKVHFEGAVDLPSAPTGTHWEYQVNGGAFNIYSSETKFDGGQEVTFQLFANEGYVLGEAVKSDSKLVTVAVPNAEALQSTINNDLNFSYESQKILNMPTAPTGTHWEYKVADQPFSADAPFLDYEYFNGGKRFELEIRLAPDSTQWTLETNVSRSISADGIVSTNGYQEDLDDLKDVPPTRGRVLPRTPDHARWTRMNEAKWLTPTSGPYWLYWLEADEGWILSHRVEGWSNGNFSWSA